MSLRKTLAKVLVCGVLQFGAFSGSVTPEELEKLMNAIHRTKIVHVVKKDEPLK
ncbi:MAG TPA: hypothetical protein VEK57_06995 [Thermoanaerobaculia bacterium]|nr:hypothetical protein [Thermoanaerobaculia bacterium]